MSKRIPLAIVTLALLLIWAGCSSIALPDELTGEEPEAGTGPLEASGFLEATEVSVVSEVGGRVLEVLAGEANEVTAGQVVVRLDAGLLEASRSQALAAVGVARANLASLEAEATPEELAAAQARIDEANAQLEGATLASGSAWASASNPQAIDVQIAAAQTQIDLALRQVEALRIDLEQAQIKLGWLRTVDEDERDGRAIEFQEYEVQIIEAKVRAAEAQYLGAQQKLDLLQQQRQRPLSALAQAHSATSRIGIAEAQIELAEAGYDLVENGALPEEIAIAQAQLDAVEAQVALINAQISQLTLTAPVDGIIATQGIYAGETAQPGVPLLTISDLSSLELVVYIPETQIGRVRLNAPVEVSVDAFPRRTFEGVVTLIGREAEFTPRNVQTEEDRVSLVFAVHIQIDNPEGDLKPGMPADAVIETLD